MTATGADGVMALVHDTLLVNETRPYEFTVPHTATKGGSVKLECHGPLGVGGMGRCCQIAEVWLLKGSKASTAQILGRQPEVQPQSSGVGFAHGKPQAASGTAPVKSTDEEAPVGREIDQALDPCSKPAGPPTGSCSHTAPAGFALKGMGWFEMSPAQKKAHPLKGDGDNRPSAHPPNGHNNISIECCSLYCLADVKCRGFHVYDPCTWTGDHSNCYVAYTSNFTSHPAASPAFLRDDSSPHHAPPPGWEQMCTAPVPVSNTTCLGGHTLKLDSSGNIQTWLPESTAHHDLVTQAMAFLDRIGNDPANGLPVYLTHGQLPSHE